jgi:hypothetical protein
MLPASILRFLGASQISETAPRSGAPIFKATVCCLEIRHESRSLLSQSTMSTLKQLDIRISAVKRLTKEMKSRRVDVETEKKRKEKFISEGEDQWTVGKQVSVHMIRG